MDSVIIRKTEIGSGVPKICVPIVGRTEDDIIEGAKALKTVPKDLAEWRADWYEDVFREEKVKAVLGRLREILGETPLLFTFRTAKEGGEKAITEKDYLSLNQMAIESGKVDLVDVEIFRDKETVKNIISCARKNMVKVIASNHDFQKTPPKEEIIRRLRYMQDAGADILKIAVMPQKKSDVAVLLSATEEMTAYYAKKPVVTMAMSGLGVISRLTGEFFGSAITFGSARKASAPGQIPAEHLQEILDILHSVL